MLRRMLLMFLKSFLFSNTKTHFSENNYQTEQFFIFIFLKKKKWWFELTKYQFFKICGCDDPFFKKKKQKQKKNTFPKTNTIHFLENFSHLLIGMF